MALTEQQKAENKAAQQVRDQAHRARYKQLNKALAAVETAPDVLRTKKEFDSISALFDAAIEQRLATEQALRAQIAQLEEQIKALRQNPEFDALKARRATAADAWQQATRSAMHEAESKFPDMASHARFSATGWQPPTEVLAEMEAARRAATPESVASKKGKNK